MQTLHHVALEKYRARYTEFLADWEAKVFGEKFNVEEIVPVEPFGVLDIVTGEVLDSVNRPLHALGQCARLIAVAKTRPLRTLAWFSDFYTPGLDGLAYSRADFLAYSFMWAQTFDRYDFTTQFPWMRDWERMAFQIYRSVFVASTLLADLTMTAIPEAEGKLHVVGLPFDSRQVFSVLPIPSATRDIDVVFSSRFDQVKCPEFFLNLVEAMPELKFAICTGHEKLKGNDPHAVQRAYDLEKSTGGRLIIHENLNKEQYYFILSRSRVQFNCALQDWVSFTLLEALTYGCVPVYPMERSFVEVFAEHPNFLYQPNSLQSAAAKIFSFTERIPTNYELMRASTLAYHDATLHRISKIIQNDNGY